MWSNWNLHALLMEKPSMENSGKQFGIKAVTIKPSNSTPEYLPKRNENTCAHKNLTTNTYNNMKLTKTQMSLKR